MYSDIFENTYALQDLVTERGTLGGETCNSITISFYKNCKFSNHLSMPKCDLI